MQVRTPHQPGDRVKTDSRDALKLARLHAAGQLRAVLVPEPPLEALRDLVRAREDLRGDLMATRHRVSKMLLRRGVVWSGPGETWSQRHLEWLIVEQAAEPRGAPLVGRLRCLRGIDTLSAVGLVAEIGDPHAFTHPKRLASYLGLVPSEQSSGATRRQGSITKAGSSQARRLLVEAAWHYRRPPRISLTLRRRQAGQPPAAIDTAWRAQLRLHQRWAHLDGVRAKRRTSVAVAVARELACFVWEIARQPD